MTEAATASLAAGNSGTGSAQSANIPGPVNWNAKSVALFNTNDSDASLLPREANFQTSWKGVVAGGDGAALADGNYTLCLKVSDGDSNISDCDTSVLFKIDRTPPEVTLADSKGTIREGGITNGQGFAVTVNDTLPFGFAPAAVSGPGRVELYRGAELIGSNVEFFPDLHAFTLAELGLTALPEGLITVKAFDQAGNAAAVVNFKSDTNPPKLILTDSRGPIAAQGGATTGQGFVVTVNDALRPDGSAATVVSGPGRLELYRGAELIGSNVALFPDRHAYTLAELGLTTLLEGLITVKAFDQAGNEAAGITFTSDRNLPKITLNDSRGSVPAGGTTNGQGFAVTVNDALRPNGSAAEGVSGPGRIELYLGGSLIGSSDADFPALHAYTAAELGVPTLPQDLLMVKAFDQAGNAAMAVDFRVDRTAPMVAVEDSRGTLAEGGPTRGLGISITADDRLGPDGRVAPIVSGIGKVELFKDGILLGADVRLYDDSHTYAPGDFGLVSLPEGMIVAKITDKVGNVTSATFLVDLTPPTVAVAGVEARTVILGGLTDSPYITATSDDALSGVHALSLLRTNGSTVSGPLTFLGKPGTVRADFPDLPDSEPGVSYVVRAEDSAGNVTDFPFRVRHAPKVTFQFLATFDYDYFFEYYGASAETFTIPYSTLTITYRDAFGISAFDIKRNGVSVLSKTYAAPVLVDTAQFVLEDGDYTFTVDTPRGQSTSGAFTKYTVGLQPVLTRAPGTVTLEGGKFNLHFPIVCHNSGPPGTGLGPLAIRPVGVEGEFHVFRDPVAIVSCGGQFDGPLANGLYALVGSDHGFDVESFFEIDTQLVSHQPDYGREIFNQVNIVPVFSGAVSLRLAENGFTPERGTSYWNTGSADTGVIDLFQSTDTFVPPYGAIGAALLEPLPRRISFAASYSNFDAGLESAGDTGLSQAWDIAVDAGPFLPSGRWKLFFSTRAAQCGTDNGVPITANCPYEFDFRLDQTRPPMMLEVIQQPA